MTSTRPEFTFDARPLTEPVDPRGVSAFAAELRARGTSGPSVSTIIAIVSLAIAAMVFIPVTATVVIAIASSSRSPWTAAIPLVILAVILVGGGALAWVGVRGARERRYRLHRFAQANGMSYEAKVSDPPLPGMIFSIGGGRVAKDLVRGTSPRFVEFGNYQYTVKSGKNSTTYSWGYVAVKLDVPLPNIVLDAEGNNSMFGSNLPAAFQKEQRLSLEGDFDKYFALYCPAGYERDALYLFTPDIMARFIDNAAQLDVEIVDDWLFLYTKRQVSTLDAATWAWLFGTVGALITKFDQWARWRDERLLEENPAAASVAGTHQALPFAAPAGMLTPPPGVAQQGRRLKRRFTWLPIVVMIGFGVLWFWMQLR
ncbi:hypothetical protein [Microbacterium sp. LWO13-1.2]|uniref:hypothetical protein n=1 Tax=Microbacterium sp. LWO13-1.2 TaxID=3135262 RepID=UPI0031395DB4